MKANLPAGKSPHTIVWEVPAHLPGNKTRRNVDTGGLVLFQAAMLGLIAWSDHKAAAAMALLGIPILGMDLVYYFSPPKQRAIRDPKPELEHPAQIASIGSFALELIVLLAPPVAFITWLLFLVWQHQMLTRNELMIVVIALPAIVGLVSWIIKIRMTRYHVGIKNQATEFIAFSMLGTWIGSTFFFIVFLICFLMKLFQA